jgi:hypothetical protein
MADKQVSLRRSTASGGGATADVACAARRAAAGLGGKSGMCATGWGVVT